MAPPAPPPPTLLRAGCPPPAACRCIHIDAYEQPPRIPMTNCNYHQRLLERPWREPARPLIITQPQVCRLGMAPLSPRGTGAGLAPASTLPPTAHCHLTLHRAPASAWRAGASPGSSGTSARASMPARAWCCTTWATTTPSRCVPGLEGSSGRAGAGTRSLCSIAGLPLPCTALRQQQLSELTHGVAGGCRAAAAPSCTVPASWR